MTSSSLAFLLLSFSFNMAKASSGVMASVMYRNQTDLTNSSGEKSQMSFQRGLPRALA